MFGDIFFQPCRQPFWIADACPPHPRFEDLAAIGEITDSVNRELMGYFLEAYAMLLAGDSSLRALRRHAGERWPILAALALKTQRYGVIYFLSRSEARAALALVHAWCDWLDDAGRHLAESRAVQRIFNFAVQRFIRVEHRQLQFCEDKVVPDRCFNTVSRGRVVAHERDFGQEDPSSFLDAEEALYDLHDFSHYTTASLCSDLYGAKYFDHLIDLPDRFKELIWSPGFRTDDPRPFADRLAFSEYLTHLFHQLDHRSMSDEAIEAAMARRLFPYYLAEGSMWHPSTGTWQRASRAVEPEELAVLAQNKPYELPASEMEQQLFTRGGVDVPDVLEPLSTSERVECIANMRSERVCHEARNVFKHRAHKRAYRLVALSMLEDPQRHGLLPEDRVLLQDVVEHVDYADHFQESRRNLFREVGKRYGLASSDAKDARRQEEVRIG